MHPAVITSTCAAHSLLKLGPMFPTSLRALLVSVVLIPACGTGRVGDVPCKGSKCDGPDQVGEVCTSPAYGDGKCDPTLDCAAPDIDCFVTFDNDEAEAAWFAGLEQALAANLGRQPRALLDTSVPRFSPTRELL